MATTGDSDRGREEKKKSHECACAAEATGVTGSPPLYACALLSPPTAVSGTVSGFPDSASCRSAREFTHAPHTERIRTLPAASSRRRHPSGPDEARTRGSSHAGRAGVHREHAPC